MQSIRDLQTKKTNAKRPMVSFEFFPPKSEEGERTFFEASLPELAKLNPDFCSVTYGAGGGTRTKTLEITDRIQREHRLPCMAHLTCVGSTREHLLEYLQKARELGIRNILALRGDPPAGTTEFQATAGGFEYSWQLVNLLKGMGEFCIGTAGFPEGHIACKEGKYIDWERLKAKIDYGADFVITQLFFSNRDFFEFHDYLRKQGVTVPIYPGILPISSTAQIKRFTAICGASIPPELAQALDRLGSDEAGVVSFGIDYAIRQCVELLNRGVPGIHFYTLNRASSVSQILRALPLG